MLISKKQTIEDIIVEYLAKSPNTDGPSLLRQIHQNRPATTKQAMYYSLSNLLNEEIVVKAKNKYFLSKIWLLKLQKLCNIQETTNDSVFKLKDGESVTYKFPNLLVADTYWAHIFQTFVEWIPKDKPVFAWYPHDWFAICRQKIEQAIFQGFIHNDKRKFLGIHGKTDLDKQFRENWKNTHVSISTGVSGIFESNIYINVFDDFIIKVIIDKDTAEKIDMFYHKHKNLDDIHIDALTDIVSTKNPVKIVIYRNHKKATTIRKQISKEFAIPAMFKI